MYQYISSISRADALDVACFLFLSCFLFQSSGQGNQEWQTHPSFSQERSGGEYHRQSYQHLSCRELRDYREEWCYGKDSSQLAEYHQIEIKERY